MSRLLQSITKECFIYLCRCFHLISFVRILGYLSLEIAAHVQARDFAWSGQTYMAASSYGNNDEVLFPFITKVKQASTDFSPIPG